jgi:hypothetical protein
LQLVGVPVDALCGRGCVGVLEFFFYVCFEVGEFSDVLGFVVGLSLICGYVHRPPIGGSASLKVMSGKVLSVHYRSCRFVGRFVVFHVRVRLCFPYMCLELICGPCLLVVGL